MIMELISRQEESIARMNLNSQNSTVVE